MAELEWFALVGDDRLGPMSSRELARLIGTRQLRGQDLVWCEALSDWTPLARALEVRLPTRAAPATALAATQVAVPAGAADRLTEATPRLDRSQIHLSRLYLQRLADRQREGSSPRPAPAAAAAPAVRPAALAPAATSAGAPAPALSDALQEAMRTAPAVARHQPVTRLPVAPAPVAVPRWSTTAEFAMSPHAPTTVAADEASRGLHDIRGYIADALVHVLDRHEIRTLDDLASNDRLRALSGATYDCLPGSLRVIVGSTIGRARVESHVFDLLCLARSSLDTGVRNQDLRHLVREMIHSRALEDGLGAAYARVKAGFTGLVDSVASAVTRPLAPARTGREPQPLGLPPPPGLLQQAALATRQA